jgi:hypothetical protein
MRDIDDRILATPALLARLAAEARFEGGTGIYWGIAVRQGGLLVPFRSAPAHPVPVPEQQMFANDMALALNRRLHHDGAWLVLFTHPATTFAALPIIGAPVDFGRFVFLWMDRDGDVQFPVECSDDFTEVLLAGPDHWMESAEQAWQQWRRQHAALDLREGEVYRRALGECAPSQAN